MNNTLQLYSALNELERNSAARIEECYINFIENVKETLNNIIQISFKSISDTTNVLRNDVTEIKKLISALETKNLKPNVPTNQYLTIKPITELKEKQTNQSLVHDNPKSEQINLRSINLFRGAALNSLKSVLKEQFTLYENQKNGKSFNSDKESTNRSEFCSLISNSNHETTLKPLMEIETINVINNEPISRKGNLCSYGNPKNKQKEEMSNARNLYQCTFCPYKTGSSLKLNEHLSLTHNQTKKFQCLYCHEVFTIWSLLKKHQKADHLTIHKHVLTPKPRH